MTVIGLRCPECGQVVKCHPQAITFHDSTEPDQTFGTFDCPNCRQSVSKSIRVQPALRLLYLGAQLGPNVRTRFVHCEDCGNIQLPLFAYQVQVCADNEKLSFSFYCHGCGKRDAKHSSQRNVDLLVKSGVYLKVWRLPAELQETKPEDLMQADEILDFYLLLADDDQSRLFKEIWTNL